MHKQSRQYKPETWLLIKSNLVLYIEILPHYYLQINQTSPNCLMPLTCYFSYIHATDLLNRKLYEPMLFIRNSCFSLPDRQIINSVCSPVPGVLSFIKTSDMKQYRRLDWLPPLICHYRIYRKLENIKLIFTIYYNAAYVWKESINQ